MGRKKNDPALEAENELGSQELVQKKSNPHDGHRKRMMDKYEKNGISVFEEHELLEILLYSVFTRCNTNEIAHDLLDRFGTVKNVLNAPESELIQIKNISKTSALKIKFFGDLFEHISVQFPKKTVFNTVEDILAFGRNNLQNLSGEVLWIMMLNNDNTVISRFEYKGFSDNVIFDKRLFLRQVSDVDCKKIVILHNHLIPMTNASASDKRFTRKIKELSDQVDIEFLDHIIIGANGEYFSFRENGMLDYM